MGLKDWLAKGAGVGAYGGVMGRETVQNGLALGRYLYSGHGTRPTASDVFVFEDEDHMKAEGFTLYCPDPEHMPPVEDSSELSRETRAAGIAFVLYCTSNAACIFMKKANAEKFVDSMLRAIAAQMRRLNLNVIGERSIHYYGLHFPPGFDSVLDLKKPGTNDVFFLFLQEIHNQNRMVGFRREGALGFGSTALIMLGETVRAVREAAQRFGW
jgi:hypothetical protein